MTHEKRNDEGTTCSATHHTRKCNGQLVSVENGSTNKPYSDNVGPRIAVDIQTAFQQVNDGEIPRFPSVVTEVLEILRRSAKSGDRAEHLS